MKFLFLEPFFGGSHRKFAEGLIAHSRHRIHLETLPARFWKWRMRGAALYFSHKLSNIEKYDGLVITDLMSLADFKALIGPDCPPALAYFHENQITYPLAPGETRDVHFGFTDITTALTAKRVLFNSDTHYCAFFDNLPVFLEMMPEYKPKWIVPAIREKAGILHPGCQLNHGNITRQTPNREPPLIIWNHRWEFDKNPDAFFEALEQVLARGYEFQVALLGENFQIVPKVFLAARQRLGSRIVQYGYVQSQKKYLEWLRRGSIVISTADQENFGMAVVEAIRSGCLPLLPNRLAYPEIIPEAFHRTCLYQNLHQLVDRLSMVLNDLAKYYRIRQALSQAMDKYAWPNIIDCYDDELERLISKP